MARSIQSLRRRSIFPKTQNFIQHLQIQHQSQNPISCFPQILSPHPSIIQPQSRNFVSMVSEMRKAAFDNNMLRLLRNEIQSELDESPLLKQHDVFNGFKVKERPGERWISLEKEFDEREKINVEVTMFDGSVPIPKEGDKPDQPGDEEQLHITMIITIFKGESNKVLEFICSAWPDTVEIQKLFVREQAKMPKKEPYTGPIFGELDDQLQDKLYDFLEERGIDDNLCVFLHSYINYKGKAEFIRWIESVKKVIEKK